MVVMVAVTLIVVVVVVVVVVIAAETAAMRNVAVGRRGCIVAVEVPALISTFRPSGRR